VAESIIIIISNNDVDPAYPAMMQHQLKEHCHITDCLYDGGSTAAATGITVHRRCPSRSVAFISFALQILVILLAAASSKTTVGAEEMKGGENNGCTAVRFAYGDKGFSQQDVPSKMISGEHLHTCSQGFTCCTREMEHKLLERSRSELDAMVADRISTHRRMFAVRTNKFDTFFVELINRSHSSLNDMFNRTYGFLYEQNSAIFDELFGQLRSYYRTGNVDVRDAVDRFFAALMRRMFVLLRDEDGALASGNPTALTDTYLGCTTARIDRLRPFGDVPSKLAPQLQRAFVAARTFVHGLATGRDVIIAMSKIEWSQSCINGIMRMNYCSYCRGLADVKPCRNLCLNVLKGCLAGHADVDDAWNTFIDELLKLGGRLKVPFNIENVVSPIDVKISEAIMNFQENAESVTSKIYQGCGQLPTFPGISRRRRQVPNRASSSSVHRRTSVSSASDHTSTTASSAGRPRSAGYENQLERFVNEVSGRLQQSRDIWRRMPTVMCATSVTSDSDVCWNGIGSKSRYLHAVVGDGTQNQTAANPEVHVDVYQTNPAVDRILFQLRQITSRLISAYNGRDIHWRDTEIGDVGSGSGDSTSPDDDNDGDDDDDGSGSGSERISTHRPTFSSLASRSTELVTRVATPSPRSRGIGDQDGYRGGSSSILLRVSLGWIPLLVTIYNVVVGRLLP
jgi:hypothetical protein